MSEAEKLKLANRAITQVLERIRDNDKVRYELGYGTKTLGLLCTAYAEINGGTAVEVASAVLRCPRSELDPKMLEV
jgi:hypothetical protein